MIGGLVGLRQLREQYLMTQRAVAERAGITVTTLSRIENGKTIPSFTTLQRLAEVFRLSPQEIREVVFSNQLPLEGVVGNMKEGNKNSKNTSGE